MSSSATEPGAQPVPTGEVAALVAIQGALLPLPGALAAARGLSHFGEHSLGWLGLAAAGAAVDGSRRREYLAAGAGAFAAHAASVVLKRIVRRRRPHHPAIAVGARTPSKLSFPSSHASSTAAAAVLMAPLIFPARPLAATAAAAAVVAPMALSRLVLGVHYPSDVAAGVALGATTAVVTRALAPQLFALLVFAPGPVRARLAKDLRS